MVAVTLVEFGGGRCGNTFFAQGGLPTWVVESRHIEAARVTWLHGGDWFRVGDGIGTERGEEVDCRSGDEGSLGRGGITGIRVLKGETEWGAWAGEVVKKWG